MPRRRRSLSKNPRVDKGPQPLMFNPALTTCASERMKTQRFSYFADFAARRPAAAGQFRPVSRGGTSCFLREAKPVKLKKVAFSHFFDTLTPPVYMGEYLIQGLFGCLGSRLVSCCALGCLARIALGKLGFPAACAVIAGVIAPCGEGLLNGSLVEGRRAG